MADGRRLFQVQTQSGEPVTVGDLTLTPQSQSVILHWPNGGFVWNRPVAVVVERRGERERVPIADVTLMAQGALLALAVLVGAASLIRSRARRM